MAKPTVFIGSSLEGLDVARTLQTVLAEEADAVLWSEQRFPLGDHCFDSLLKSLNRVDYAVLVIMQDDLATQRGRAAFTSRENVIFELGLFMGRLGRSKIFVITEDGDSATSLPPYLAGITVARFHQSRSESLLAAVSPASAYIREHIAMAVRDDSSQAPQATVKPYSCFISHCAQDRVFADQLCNDLQDVGITCWLDSKDLKVGDDIKGQINRAVQLSDKVLLILSEASINSAWVQREIEVALEKESNGHRKTLFPLRIDDAVFKVAGESVSFLINSRVIGDFSDWAVPENYRRSFSRLVKDLTVTAAAEQDRGLCDA